MLGREGRQGRTVNRYGRGWYLVGGYHKLYMHAGEDEWRMGMGYVLENGGQGAAETDIVTTYRSSLFVDIFRGGGGGVDEVFPSLAIGGR